MECFVLLVEGMVLLIECFVLLMECMVLLVEGIGGGNPCTFNCTPTPAGDPTRVWPDRFLFSYLFNAFDEEHKQHSHHQALSEHLVTSIKFINSICLEHNLPLFKFNSLSPKRPSLKCIKNLAGWFHVYSISGWIPLWNRELDGLAFVIWPGSDRKCWGQWNHKEMLML